MATSTPLRILFAASEAWPLIKTGGLADVAGSLPASLRALDQDVVLLLPAYQSVLEKVGDCRTVTRLWLDGIPGQVEILECSDQSVRVWLVKYAPAFERPGNPYMAPDGQEWPDNAERFAVFGRVIVQLALGHAGIDWVPDLVHCNDWQTGLAPALLSRHYPRPATVFTIHNLSYQGLYPYSRFHAMGLPEFLWSDQGMEFYGQFSFIKGGLMFADMISTVSPTYAQEIRTPQFGYGLNGLLQHRSARLTGILNGIDTQVWNPAADPHLPAGYDADKLAGKKACKKALQQRAGLPVDPAVPVIGFIGRLVQQKGIDLIFGTLPNLMRRNLQLVFLGSGDASYQTTLTEWCQRFPDRMAATIGYDEPFAHLIEAGSDMFLMPSRFEPCGLNQMYSLRYGTLPIVHHTGGLADTVIDVTDQTLKNKTATGFVFHEDQISALEAAIDRAVELYPQSNTWRAIQKRAMKQDFSWDNSARAYLDMYLQAIRHCHPQKV